MSAPYALIAATRVGAGDRDRTLSTAPAWTDSASCSSTDPEIFFPEKGRKSERETQIAKSICRECPVKQQCLEYALAYPDTHGIWAGLTADELATLRMRRRLAAYKRAVGQ